MSEIFEWLTPFVRIVETEKINSYFLAITIFSGIPKEADNYLKDDNDDSTFGVLENDGPSLLYITHKTDEYFIELVTKRTLSILVQIDRECLQSENKDILIEKLNNHLTYIQILLDRFDKKSKEEKNILEIIPLQLKRIQKALTDRLDHYKSSSCIIPPNISQEGEMVKINWLSDDATLVTIFSDLVNGNIFDQERENTIGYKCIRNTQEELINFIHANFINKAGVPIEKDTIKRCLKSDKVAKRNRIYLTM